MLRTHQGTPVDTVILTALHEEEAAVRLVFGPGETYRWRGQDLHLARLDHGTVLLLPLGGVGNVGSAEATERAIGVWNPARVVIVGIAGGARCGDGPRLGDVLVPDQVVGYESAKVSERGTSARFEVYRPAHDLLAAALAVRSAEWAGSIVTPRPEGGDPSALPRLHVGPVLSGEKVLADQWTLAGLRESWPKAVGVEMEGLGAALASYRGGPGFLMVKAVSDYADGHKDDRWRRYAAESAARFARALLVRLPGSAGPSGVDRPQAVPAGAPRTFPGSLKVRVCQRLGGDWPEVADYFEVPPHARARFPPGDEPRRLWEWLEVRGKLYDLPAVLDQVGRPDLADLLRANSAKS